MKQLTKITFFFLMFFYIPMIHSQGQFIQPWDFKVDGIYYNYIGYDDIIGNYRVAVTYYGRYVWSEYNQEFYSADYRGDITIPESVTYDGVTYLVTDIDSEAFRECPNLTSLFLPNTIRSIGWSAFRSCSGLTSINLPSTIRYIDDYSFFGCISLTNINIPNSVRTIGNSAFEACRGLTKIQIPDSVISIGDNAFENCNGLTCLTIPKSVTAIGDYALKGCISLDTLNFNAISCADFNSSYYSWPFYNLNISTINIGENVQRIPAYFAYGLTNLTSITIPNSITEIGGCAFHECSSLDTLNFNAISCADFNCSYYSWPFYNLNISTINIGENVQQIPAYFAYGLTNLACINIPNSVTNIGYNAFDGTPWYNNQPDGMVYAGLVAYKYKGSMPNGTSIIIKEGTIAITDFAFEGCSELNSITIPNSVSIIGSNAFSSCDKISTLMITGDGEWPGEAIDCSTSLFSVDSRITSLKGINVSPKDNVYCYASIPPECDEHTFTDYSATLHVPAAALAAYFTAPYWSNFANIVADAVQPSSISISHNSVEVNIADQFKLNASVTPVNSTPNEITWKSTDTTVATVSDGLVTAIGVGECDIIIECLNLQAICHVVVNDATIVITLDQQEAELLPNHMLTLTPNATPVSPEGYSVTSSDPTVAAARLVNGNVQIVGIKEGTTIITVSSTDNIAVPATCLIEVYTERGDVNCDGFVNISDVTVLIDALLGSDSAYSVENSDCNNDGNVTISDVTALIDALLGGATLPGKDSEIITVNGVSFKMMKVKGGTFLMGATDGQGDQAYDDEYPVHEVTLSSYSIGETEVTQALWQAIMEANPSGMTGNLNRPVETVSWNDCQTFIAKLNQMTGKSFRLPTEAEWEFAARGGNLSHDYMYAGSNDLDEVAWNISNIPSQQPNTEGYGTQPVAQKAPNELGLFDMSGNVYEWCSDWFDAYPAEAQINPTGPGDDEGCHYRVNRGGSWNRYGRSSRVSLRNNATPESAYFNIGLRLAM